MIEGVQSAQPTYLTNSLRVLSVDQKGQFIGVLGSDQFSPTGVICLFGGTDTLASSGAGPVPIADAPPPTTGSTTPGGGGGLTVPGKFSIHFPAGAFSSPLNLTYTPIFSPTHALPNGDAWLDFFTLDATANNQPVTQFDKPYTMVISYSGDLPRQLGVVETNLNVVFWDGSAWKPMLPCAGCGVNLNNHHITVVANHFTEFALIGTGDRRDVYLPITLR